MKVYIIQWIDCRVNVSWGVVIDRCRQDLRVKRLFSIVAYNEIKPFIGQVMSSLSLIIQQVHFDFLLSHNFVIDFPLQESINMSVWRQFDQICCFFSNHSDLLSFACWYCDGNAACEKEQTASE